jgi:crotonobetainyl-CoA:carnitine CoA-transferase CaiB-like acyl-CoA transferase
VVYAEPAGHERDELLSGLVVVNFSHTLVGAHVAQLFADFGAEVFWIEPPGGSPLRSQPAWPFWARGAKSVELDLRDAVDCGAARDLVSGADVAIETFRPGVMERLGLSYDELAARNPGLVLTSVTAFGRSGPLSALKGYEGIVMAKLGAYTQFSAMVEREGPAFAGTPYGAFTAAMVALQGTLAALIERERSGLGQHVDTTIAQAFNAHDVMFWMTAVMVQKMSAMARPEVAPPPVAPSPSPAAAPRSGMSGFALMAGLTADGHWLQFSQTTTKQTAAFVRAVGLEEEWGEVVASGDPARVAGFTVRMHEAVHARPLAEWQRLFDVDPDVFAEVYRSGTELLHHPQLLHDGRIAEAELDGYGSVRQPGPLAAMTDTPGRGDRRPPTLDEHRADLSGRGPRPAVPATPSVRPPLEGVSVLELGTFYAAPYGASMLADLGARVIKVEQLDGDPLRWLIPIPEVGAVKALLGKESVAVNVHSDEGREIVYELTRRADIVLQSFRAGVAQRLGLDATSLRSINPFVAYHSGPGFGVGGPYGHRPAYAPTIGAGSGMARRNIGSDVPSAPDLAIAEIMEISARLASANMSVGTADGFSAVAVGAALALGLFGRARRGHSQESETTMLATMAHVLSEDMIEYARRAPAPRPDCDLYGLSALYRLYRAANGWVFLAVVTDRDWAALAGALGLAADARDDEEGLADALAARFVERPAAAWEAFLTGLDVGCVEVAAGPTHAVLMGDGGLGRELGFVTDVVHPVLGPHPRPTALVRFSRSTTVDDGTAPGIGQHTDAVLGELGYDAARRADLRRRGVIG